MKDKIEIIDVRDTDEFNENHMPGSKSMQLTDLEKRYKELNQDSPIKVVCNRGGQKSKKALDFLKEKGFKNVSIKEGGIVAWREERSK
jgi:rhodanese-related sulfurtransferase